MDMNQISLNFFLLFVLKSNYLNITALYFISLIINRDDSDISLIFIYVIYLYKHANILSYVSDMLQIFMSYVLFSEPKTNH